jgi:hypothetical protein
MVLTPIFAVLTLSSQASHVLRHTVMMFYLYLYDTFVSFTSYYENVIHIEKRLHEHAITFFVLRLEATASPILKVQSTRHTLFPGLDRRITRDIVRSITLSTLKMSLTGQSRSP